MSETDYSTGHPQTHLIVVSDATEHAPASVDGIPQTCLHASIGSVSEPGSVCSQVDVFPVIVTT